MVTKEEKSSFNERVLRYKVLTKDSFEFSSEIRIEVVFFLVNYVVFVIFGILFNG